MDKATLGRRIREARMNKKMTQEILAEKADIGVTYLGELERGKKMPSINVLIKIIETLDISADYLLRDEIKTGTPYVFHEITEKMDGLTPKQVKAISELIDVYIKNL